MSSIESKEQIPQHGYDAAKEFTENMHQFGFDRGIGGQKSAFLAGYKAAFAHSSQPTGQPLNELKEHRAFLRSIRTAANIEVIRHEARQLIEKYPELPLQPIKEPVVDTAHEMWHPQAYLPANPSPSHEQAGLQQDFHPEHVEFLSLMRGISKEHSFKIADFIERQNLKIAKIRDEKIASLQSELSALREEKREAEIERDYARHASIEAQKDLQSQLVEERGQRTEYRKLVQEIADGAWHVSDELASAAKRLLNNHI